MEKSVWSKIFIIGLCLILSMNLAMFPVISLSVAIEPIEQAEPLSTISKLDNVMMGYSPKSTEATDFVGGDIPGYADSGKFIAPIDAPDLNAMKIYTVEDLDYIRNNLTGSYVLMNDIDMTDFNSGQWMPIGSNYSNPFKGIFDGQGHIIRNMSITGDTYQYVGLFGYTSSSAIIINTGLKDTYINTSYPTSFAYVGGICGYNSGSIYNCYNTGEISFLNSFSSSACGAGGICGFSTFSVSSCYNTGNIYSSSYAGGICGGIHGPIIISNCYNTGDIFSSNTAGGICGFCFGNVSLGDNPIDGTGSILNCYNTGGISSSRTAGGICGIGADSISNCYDVGDILSSSSDSASYSGGICGSTSISTSISNCVTLSSRIDARTDVEFLICSSWLIGGGVKKNNLALEGIAGHPINDANGLITQAQAREQVTYEELGWDFGNIWEIVPGYDYPQFRRVLDDNADLVDLSISPGKLDQDFSYDWINYTASVLYEVEGITIIAEVKHTGAKIDGDGLKSLKVGENYFEIIVTAEDGKTTKSYTITINRTPPSSDTSLSNLGISPGALDPDFQADITSYTVSVPYGIEEVIVVAEASHPTATIAGDGQKDLAVGDNLFEITVTAQDGSTKTYTIVVTREPQAQLINLILSTGELDPDFDPDTSSYTVSVDGSVSCITITALAGGSNINIGFSEGGAYQVGNQWISDPLDLDSLEKIITVYVHKEGLPQSSYSITVKRDLPNTSEPIYTWEATGDIGTVGRVLFDVPGDKNFLDKYALVCDEDIDAEIYFSPKRTENAIAAGQNTYVFAVRLPNGETREDISFSFKPIGGVVEKNKIIIYGDINEDGSITTTDATLVTRWAGGNNSTVMRNILAADVNGDAYITTTDATLITRRAGGNTSTVFSIETRF